MPDAAWSPQPPRQHGVIQHFLACQHVAAEIRQRNLRFTPRRFALGGSKEIFRGHYREHTRHPQRSTGIDPEYASMGVRTAQHRAPHHAG